MLVKACSGSPAAAQVFLPYAYRERPPLDRHWFCDELKLEFDGLQLQTTIDVRVGGRLGIMVRAARASGAEELWSALAHSLPEGMFDAALARRLLGAA